MTSFFHAPHVVVLNRWSVGWSGGQPPYEDVLDHDAFRVSYLVDAEGFKGLTDRIKASCLVETVTDIKDLQQLATAFAALVAKGGEAFRLVALSEWDLLNAAALRERFGVAGMQPAMVIGVRDKVRMKERIAAAGIKAPTFAPCPDLASLEAFIHDHGFPVVLKPRKMAASIGVVILPDQAQFDAEKAHLAFDDMECETYCPGAVFHIDGLMRNGKLAYAVPFRYTRPPVDFVQGLPLGAMALPLGAVRDQMIAFGAKVAAALSIDNTHFHLEVIMDESVAAPSPMFLEVGARVGGADIPRAVALITGVDAVKQQLRVELGLDLLPMDGDPAITAGYYLVPFPKGLPRLVSSHPEMGRAVLPTLVDEHRRMPGEILDGSGGYLKIPARFVFHGSAEAVARDLATVKAKHSYEHAPVPRVGLLALVHKGLSFCHEIAACARSLGIDLFVISSKHGPTAPLASLAPHVPFVYVTEEESLNETIILEGLGRMEEASCAPLACIATMESYRLLSAGINARLGGCDASVEALKLAMDKLAARTVLREAGLSAVTAETVTAALLETAKASGLPYFIKPRRGAASFGAFPLTEAVTYRQIEALQEQMRADSFVNAVFYGDYSFILERAIPGPEYCFEVVVVDGEVHIAVSHGKTLVQTKHSVLEDQMVSPGITDAVELSEAHSYLVRMFAKLGLTHGLYHVELRRSPWGWELIEVNTRIGGGLINDSGKARLESASLLDLWIFGLLWNYPRFNVRERFATAARRFESAPGAPAPTIYTLQQYFYGEPGKTIAAINTQASQLEPFIQILSAKAGDRIPASNREHDLAMVMWTLTRAAWQGQAESLKQEAPRFWDFVYEDTAPGRLLDHGTMAAR
jgi:biotin carboxylase